MFSFTAGGSDWSQGSDRPRRSMARKKARRHVCGADSSHVRGLSTAANDSLVSPVVGKADSRGFQC